MFNSFSVCMDGNNRQLGVVYFAAEVGAVVKTVTLTAVVGAVATVALVKDMTVSG
jgi:hypothetical protein